MEKRKLEEIEFHNKIRNVNDDTHVSDTRWTPEIEETIKNNPYWVNMKYYAIERKSRKMVLNWFKNNCSNKICLDYCCGNGEDGVFIAKNGAQRVVGIDISDVSIKNCEQWVARENVQNITYEIKDAENTGFDDNCFDIITEYGALHHLDLEKSFAELARILKPDGKIICNESLAHNPIIHWYRKFTPDLRTKWEVEHILRKRNFKVANKYFGNVEMHFYHFFTLLAVPFRKTFFFNGLLKVLELIDGIILNLPIIKWQAWQVVFIISKPNKDMLTMQGRSKYS